MSLLDSRALGDMSAVCAASGVRIIAFGVIAGGLLTDRWLGKPEPSQAALDASWSLSKYRRYNGFDINDSPYHCLTLK